MATREQRVQWVLEDIATLRSTIAAMPTEDAEQSTAKAEILAALDLAATADDDIAAYIAGVQWADALAHLRIKRGMAIPAELALTIGAIAADARMGTLGSWRR